jgi:S-adenosylmethionine uptake transporter
MKRFFQHHWQALSGNTRGVFLVMLAMACWAVLDAANKALMARGIAPRHVLFLQATLVLTLVSPAVVWTRARILHSRQPLFHVLRGGIIITSAWCAAYAVSRLPLAQASAYLMTAALFMLPLGAWLLGEKPGWMRWLGVIVGFSGVLAILKPGVGAIVPAVWAALLGALMEAMLGVILKKYSQGEHPIAVMTWSQLACWLVFGVFSGFTLPSVPFSMLWLLPVIGVSAAGIYLSYFYAYRSGEASAIEAGSFSLLLFSPTLGYVFFAEVPDLNFWLGAGLLVGGIGMVIYEGRATIRP